MVPYSPDSTYGTQEGTSQPRASSPFSASPAPQGRETIVLSDVAHSNCLVCLSVGTTFSTLTLLQTVVKALRNCSNIPIKDFALCVSLENGDEELYSSANLTPYRHQFFTADFYSSFRRAVRRASYDADPSTDMPSPKISLCRNNVNEVPGPFDLADCDPGFFEGTQTPPVCKVEEISNEDSWEEKFLNEVFEENGTFVSSSQTTSTESQGCSGSSQLSTTPPSSLLSMTESSQGSEKSKKRKGRSDEDEEWDRPNRPQKHQRPEPGEPSGRESQQRRRLACHFHILDKQKYRKNNVTGRRYETCSGPGWPSMHHLKLVKVICPDIK